jgi:hypothetical protein
VEPSEPDHSRHHYNIIRRYFEIVNLYPKIEDPGLRQRIEEFTMSATPEELFRMQATVFDAASSFMSGDPGWETIMKHLDGKKIGLAIGKEYESTVSLEGGEFRLGMGITDRHIPVFSTSSRRDYVDALLRRKDLLRMIVTGRLGATHKLTLARWGLSFFHLLSDDELFEGLLDRWVDAEGILSETLKSMGF